MLSGGDREMSKNKGLQIIHCCDIYCCDIDCGFVSFSKGKGKAVPLQARCGLEGSRRFRLPVFHDIRHLTVVMSPSRTGLLYPQECSWYSFSLGAECNPGPW